MAFRISTGTRQQLLGTSSFKALFDGGVMDLFTGSQPTTADAVETGTKLVRISSTSGVGLNDGLRFGTALAGDLSNTTPAWQGTVVAAGVAGWFRFYGTGATSGVMGSSGTNGTGIRVDGNVGLSGADLVLTHTNLALDSTLTVGTGTVTVPAE